jgi:hypothetical protein
MSGTDKPPSESPDLLIKSATTDRRPGGTTGRSWRGVHSRSRQTSCRGVLLGGECTPSMWYGTVSDRRNRVLSGRKDATGSLEKGAADPSTAHHGAVDTGNNIHRHERISLRKNAHQESTLGAAGNL